MVFSVKHHLFQVVPKKLRVEKYVRKYKEMYRTQAAYLSVTKGLCLRRNDPEAGESSIKLSKS